jgi:hypothetical protein
LPVRWPRVNRARASRVPRNPAPPVISTFIFSPLFAFRQNISGQPRSRRRQNGEDNYITVPGKRNSTFISLFSPVPCSPPMICRYGWQRFLLRSESSLTGTKVCPSSIGATNWMSPTLQSANQDLLLRCSRRLRNRYEKHGKVPSWWLSVSRRGRCPTAGGYLQGVFR